MSLPAHAESRRRNLGRVLRLVHERGPTRQVEVSDALELTRSTGISLVGELVGLGLVTEEDAAPLKQRGRPSRVVAPADEVVVVAAEIAAQTARVDIVGLGGPVVSGQDIGISPTSLGPSRTLRHIVAGVGDLLACRPGARIVGAAIAVHGAVDHEREIVFGPNLSWDGADLGEFDALLRRALPGQAVPPVVVGNDADLGALGELRRGAGRDHAHFLYLSAERGVGGGLVVDRHVLLGASGLAGEVGHMKVGGAQRLCSCGQRGCWETEIGAGAIERAARVASIDALLDRAEAGDHRAVDVVEGVASWLGRGIGILLPVLQPEAVVVGGHLARVVELARPRLDEVIGETCPPRLAAGIAIIPSQLGGHAAIIGAAEVAFDRLIDDPSGIAGIGQRGPA